MNKVSANFNEFNNKINNELKADYTFLVACQIKSVERFIKESILKNMQGMIFENKNKKYTIVNKKLDQLNSINDYIFYTTELGSLDKYVSNCLTCNLSTIFESGKNSYSIFKRKCNNHTDFYDEFVSKVRNGHFHTSMIDSISRATQYRIETAFWLLCVINELKGI